MVVRVLVMQGVAFFFFFSSSSLILFLILVFVSAKEGEVEKLNCWCLKTPELNDGRSSKDSEQGLKILASIEMCVQNS